MTPKDIIIGALYKHPDYPGVTYLGCGDCFENTPKRKFLIILKERPSQHRFTGLKVAFHNDKGSKHWWSKLSAAAQKL